MLRPHCLALTRAEISTAFSKNIRVSRVSARPLSISLSLRSGSSNSEGRPGPSQPQHIRPNPLVGNQVNTQATDAINLSGPKTPSPTGTSAKVSSHALSRDAINSFSAKDSGLTFPPPPSSAPQLLGRVARRGSSPTQGDDRQGLGSISPLPQSIDISSIITEKSSAYGQSVGIDDPLSGPMIRTKAVTGRTVFIKERVTPTSAPTPAIAFRVLERMCREQKIRSKFHSQKFHERKGLRKKRLRSQRWRARFKTGFRAAISRVLELKKQGW